MKYVLNDRQFREHEYGKYVGKVIIRVKTGGGRPFIRSEKLAKKLMRCIA